MTPTGLAILDHLRRVDALRAARAADAALDERVQALKTYQQARFANSYADLLASRRYTDAARFFLDELYGPHDFTDRDAQFARIVPALVRLFPQEIVDTVATLAELHALSEELDVEMAHHLDALPITPERYLAAWQRTGRAQDRERQIRLTVRVGEALDRYTRNVLLRHSLRLMRAPARAAGMAALQAFLERGFDTFRAMGGAQQFLHIVAARETALAASLFERAAVAPATAGSGATSDNADPLGQLP